MKIGFVIADDNEYKPFLDFALAQDGKEEKRRSRDSVSFTYNNRELIAVKAGIGKVNAATTAAFLIADDKVDIILNFGLSGAITTHCKNDIVAGSSYIECDFDLTAIGYELGKKPQETYIYKADKALFDAAMTIDGVTEAVCGCGDIFLADPVKKNLYKETFGITEFDMETGAVASVCHDAGVPFLAIRQISDTADDAAVESYRELNDKCEITLTNIIMQLLEKI
ncbi:MAG: 5'-methylthioadenosine/S-adenosylhomocysteine nucleosidase [Clostridia bacterium]|nr:5'-methylthioadenosine/S-adenosylhomocysteine nucleosidase [Clostridia bacterium]